MRGWKRRGRQPSVEDCGPVPPDDALVGALDDAIRFTASRELVTARHVDGVVELLRVASPIATEPGPVHDALHRVEATFATREIVSATEVADRLLDVRLAVRAPRTDAPAAPAARASADPRVRVRA